MLAAPYVSLKMSKVLPAGATKYHEDFVKCEDIQSANIIRDCMYYTYGSTYSRNGSNVPYM